MADSSTITAAATDSGVKAWKKATYEQANQTKANATDIGWLRNNDSRLNLVSELAPEDKQQMFKVKALSDGNLAFNKQSDQDVRVQMYDDHDRIIADSNPNMGKASENYTAMTGGDFAQKAGTYYIKVTRAEGVPANADIHYAMQMRQGDKYTNDYVTTQVALTHDARLALAANPLANMPAGLVSYNSSGSVLGDAMSQRTGLLGGVDLSSGGNIFGVSLNA